MSDAKIGLYCPRMLEVAEALGEKNPAIGAAYRHYAIALAALAQVPRKHQVMEAVCGLLTDGIVGMGEVLGITLEEQEVLKNAFASDANELSRGIQR